jgi:hypothetical protein
MEDDMHTFPVKALAVFFFLALFILISVPVMAQDQEMDDPEITSLIQEFLPEGVTLDTASDEQILTAVSAAISAYPDQAASIVSLVIQSRPEMAVAVVTAAIQAAPEEQIEAITNAAFQAAPDQAEAIISAAIEAAPPGAVPPALIRAAFVTLPTLPEGASPPSRDDQPASPVLP